MSKHLRINEKGLSMIELLAVLVLGSAIMIISTSLIVQALNNQEKITVETQLRDEADIIMAKLTKAIFTTKESDIQTVFCGTEIGSVKTPLSCTTFKDSFDSVTSTEAQNAKNARTAMINCKSQSSCSTNAYIQLTNNKKIGFTNDQIIIQDEVISISNTKLELVPYYTIEQLKNASNESKGAYIISFSIKHKKKGTTKTFQNEVLSVNNR